MPSSPRCSPATSSERSAASRAPPRPRWRSDSSPAAIPSPSRARPTAPAPWHRAYLRTLVERDGQDIARVKDATIVARLLELLALRAAERLNTSNLSQDLGLDRQTVENYLAILERLFLVGRLPAWPRNEAKRLIKRPKIHLLDRGLAATLAGLNAADWTTRRDRFGHLLESFVVQQPVAQASWADPDLRFWHYRDKDQVEVDLVITRGRQTWGVEVKASGTVHKSDGAGLRASPTKAEKISRAACSFTPAAARSRSLIRASSPSRSKDAGRCNTIYSGQ